MVAQTRVVGGDREGPDSRATRKVKPQGVVRTDEITAERHHTQCLASTKARAWTVRGSLSFLPKDHGEPGLQWQHLSLLSCLRGKTSAHNLQNLENQLTILE